jgi:hypothetical protein
MRSVRIVVMGCVFAVAAATATAQDSGRVGLTTGYPAVIGIQWHLSERTAIRPEFSFTTSSSSSQSLTDASTDFTSFNTGVSVLFYSPLRDNLKLYVAPRFAYGRTSGSGDIVESITDIYSVSGSLGGHYALSRRFAVFGEAGVQYSHQTGSVTTSIAAPLRTTSRGDNVGTRTGVGVVIYF